MVIYYATEARAYPSGPPHDVPDNQAYLQIINYPENLPGSNALAYFTLR